jgi:hypothetical protein
MFATPAECILKDLVEFGDTGCADHEQSPPHQRTHAAEHYAKLINRNGRYRRFRHANSLSKRKPTVLNLMTPRNLPLSWTITCTRIFGSGSLLNVGVLAIELFGFQRKVHAPSMQERRSGLLFGWRCSTLLAGVPRSVLGTRFIENNGVARYNESALSGVASKLLSCCRYDSIIPNPHHSHHFLTMSAQRPKIPTTIDISNIAPGASGASTGGRYATMDANVTVHIEGDDSHVFQIIRVETFDVESDDPEGPSGHPLSILVPAITIAGPGPIQVDVNQALIISVEFFCPPNPQQAVFRARAVLDNGSPTPQFVPIVATARLGILQGVSLTSPHILPGHTETFTFRIFSSLGHNVDVAFEYDAVFEPHFSAPTHFLTVPAGGSADLTVPITCASGTPEGEHGVIFRLRAQDGSQEFNSVEMGVTVTRSVTVRTNLPSDLILKRGGTVLCEITVTLTGGTAQLEVSHGPLPIGVSVNPDRQTMAVNDTGSVSLHISASPNASIGKLGLLQIFWIVNEPEITGQFGFNIAVIGDEAVFVSEQVLSQLSPENDPKPLVCDQATVTCRDDGTWNFRAHMSNEETLADVSFLLEVRLKFVDSAGIQFGETIDGALSAAGDGSATKVGLRVKGYAPAGIFVRQGNFEAFQSPTYWQNVKSTNAQFRMLAAFGEPDSPNIPDPPDIPDP